MNPALVASARTARLAREAAMPRVAYTSDAAHDAKRKAALDWAEAQLSLSLLERAEALACSEDFCHICSRCTDHFGEHSPEQILAWVDRRGMVASLLDPKYDV